MLGQALDTPTDVIRAKTLLLVLMSQNSILERINDGRHMCRLPTSGPDDISRPWTVRSVAIRRNGDLRRYRSISRHDHEPMPNIQPATSRARSASRHKTSPQERCDSARSARACPRYACAVLTENFQEPHLLGTSAFLLISPSTRARPSSARTCAAPARLHSTSIRACSVLHASRQLRASSVDHAAEGTTERALEPSPSGESDPGNRPFDYPCRARLLIEQVLSVPHSKNLRRK